jgi:hypothetical protein
MKDCMFCLCRKIKTGWAGGGISEPRTPAQYLGREATKSTAEMFPQLVSIPPVHSTKERNAA